MGLKLLRRALCLALLLGALSTWQVSWAQSGPVASQRERLTPQQRQQVKEKLRSRWQAMTPEERDEAKIQLKQRFQSLTPEQKDKLRDRWKRRRANAQGE